MLTTTLFPAPIYQSYGRGLAEKTLVMNPSQADIGRKDLGLFRAMAAEAGATAPMVDFMTGAPDRDARGLPRRRRPAGPSSRKRKTQAPSAVGGRSGPPDLSAAF